jgi:transposase
VAHSQRTFLAAKYRRIAARRGPKKALVAVEHALLTAIWTMAHTGALYDDPGADYFTRRDPERLRRHALSQLQRLGYDVTLNPAQRQPKEGSVPRRESSRQRLIPSPDIFAM